MSEPETTLAGFRDRAWHLLESGASDFGHPFHTACLATTGLGGAAEARMVVLRHAAQGAARLRMQTDRASRKVDELHANPLATLLFWAPEERMQVRARCRVDILTGTEVQTDWDALSPEARRNYGGQPPPSTPLTAPSDYTETAERARFAVLDAAVTSLDILHLGDRHRRALFEAEDGFAGMWLAP